VKKYKQLIAQLPDKTQKQMAATAKANNIVSYAPVPVAGRITNIDHASKDLTLAQINVASQDNVKTNMRFMIYRGQKLLGFLLISKVADHAAVGRVKSLHGKVQAGDNVLVPSREG